MVFLPFKKYKYTVIYLQDCNILRALKLHRPAYACRKCISIKCFTKIKLFKIKLFLFNRNNVKEYQLPLNFLIQQSAVLPMELKGMTLDHDFCVVVGKQCRTENS